MHKGTPAPTRAPRAPSPPRLTAKQKGKGTNRIEPQEQPKKPVTSFQCPSGPPPLINRATKPRASYAAAARKPAVKPAQAPLVAPLAKVAEAILQTQEPPKRNKRVRKTPNFATEGPTRKQVLVTFDKGEIPVDSTIGSAAAQTVVNRALLAANSKIRILSIARAYSGYALATNDVAQPNDLNVIRGWVHSAIPGENPECWAGLPTSKSYLKVVDIPYYSNLQTLERTTPQDVERVMRASPLSEHFFLAGLPRIV